MQFARRLLSGTYSGLKGAPEELAKAKRVLLLCEQKGTDAININYEPGEAGTPLKTLQIRQYSTRPAQTLSSNQW